MHIDDLLGAENLAAKTGDAVLAIFDHWKLEGRIQAGDDARCRRRLHVNDIGGTDDVANSAAGAFFQFDTFNHELFRQLLSYFAD
jgi:hypothetical protein